MRKVAFFALLLALLLVALLIEHLVVSPGSKPAAAAESDSLIVTLGGPSPRADPRQLSEAPTTPLEPKRGLQPPEKPRQTPDAQVQQHRLASGETVESFCARYYGSEHVGLHLRQLNGLRPEEKVPAGTTLVLPPADKLEHRYRVKKGDTLSGIAQKILGTAQRTGELTRLNDLANPNDIRENQILKLPPK
ncbi:MAG: LysM domain-containing protein [Planctomycetota bacterium]